MQLHTEDRGSRPGPAKAEYGQRTRERPNLIQKAPRIAPESQPGARDNAAWRRRVDLLTATRGWGRSSVSSINSAIGNQIGRKMGKIWNKF